MTSILCLGFDPQLYSQARSEGGFGADIAIVTLQAGDLPLTLEAIVARGASLEGRDLPAGRYVILASDAQSSQGSQRSARNADLEAVMKGFKRAYQAPPGSIIFAVLTATASKWTLQKYLQELAAEHAELRKLREQKLSAVPSMLHQVPRQ